MSDIAITRSVECRARDCLLGVLGSRRKNSQRISQPRQGQRSGVARAVRVGGYRNQLRVDERLLRRHFRVSGFRRRRNLRARGRDIVGFRHDSGSVVWCARLSRENAPRDAMCGHAAGCARRTKVSPALDTRILTYRKPRFVSKTADRSLPSRFPILYSSCCEVGPGCSAE